MVWALFWTVFLWLSCEGEFIFFHHLFAPFTHPRPPPPRAPAPAQIKSLNLLENAQCTMMRGDDRGRRVGRKGGSTEAWNQYFQATNTQIHWLSGKKPAPGGPDAGVPWAGGIGVQAGGPWCHAAGAQQGASIYTRSDLLDDQGEAGDGEMFLAPVCSCLVRLNDLSAPVRSGQEAFLRVSWVSAQPWGQARAHKVKRKTALSALQRTAHWQRALTLTLWLGLFDICINSRQEAGRYFSEYVISANNNK